MPYTTLPIVGAFYRPPAQTLLGVLPVGTDLTLMAEPDNAHDPNAVAVWLASAEIPPDVYDLLEAGLATSGHTLSTILNQEYWHLGYLPKNFAALLKSSGTVTDNEVLFVTFAISNGKPAVRFPSPVL